MAIILSTLLIMALVAILVGFLLSFRSGRSQRPFQQALPFDRPTSWLALTAILLTIFIFSVSALKPLLPDATLIQNVPWLLIAPSAQNREIENASQKLVRINQLDPHQYNTLQEYKDWAYAACSAAAMTEVMNAYGRHYRVTDVLHVESELREITPSEGLLEDRGIEHTTVHFGFQTLWGNHTLSLDDIVTKAQHGIPVIVSFPPSRYPGGHLLVVIGGDQHAVYTADSSALNRHAFTRQRFQQLWGGFTAIVTPNLGSMKQS